jgi:hypothetical protein
VRVAWLVAIVGLGGCFHAHGTVKDAQEATYKMTGAAMMSLAEDVAKQDKLAVTNIDDKQLTFDAGGAHVIVLELAGGDCSIDVRPAGEDDAAKKRASDLAIAIYDRAKAFAYSH